MTLKDSLNYCRRQRSTVGIWWVAGEFKVLRANHWETPLNLNSPEFELMLRQLKSSPCVPGSVRAEEGIHSP